MTRSRAVLTASFAVLLTGSALALSALVLDPARAAVGPLPAEGLALPAKTRVVVGIDMQRFVASPFYTRYAQKDPSKHMQALQELEEKTGLNPERDIDRVIMATGAGATAHDSAVVLVEGRFDTHRLARLIETEKKGVTWKKVEGATAYLFNEAEGRKSGALAFLDENTIVMGSLAGVEQVLTNRVQAPAALEGNKELMDLLRQVEPGSAFWMVGDQTALAQLPKGHTGGGQGPGFTMPNLKSVMVTAELEPVLNVKLTGEATDAAAAKNLADLVRGFVAMAALQSAQKPELKELGNAISVTADVNKVHVSARVPYELLDALQAGARPKVTAAAPAQQ
jgi:hypothetical protein